MTAKKKILFAVTKGNWGGAQRYVFDLATNIPKNEWDITVACGAGTELIAKLKEQNIRTIRIGSLGRDVNIVHDLLSFFEFISILKKERPDVVHLNSSKMGAMGTIAARLMGINKIIFTGHGWAWNEDRNLLSKVLITILHWFTVELSHYTIAVSEKIAYEIKDLPLVTKEKIVVVYNGVSTTDYLERFAARAALSRDVSEKFWIGTIAELHRNKGLDNLITAYSGIAESNPDTALLIIGEGEERAQLTDLISKLNLTKKVHLLGFVKDAPTFLKAFDVFVLPSRTEAFPYVPLEAGLAQLPVIASKVGGIPEVITDRKNGLLVNSGDIYSLTSSMRELLEDSAEAAIFGHNLRKTVEENFSIERMVENTLAVYNNTMQTKSPVQ
ncbi:MAG TPA: glycosyltransferase family 4 protein [Candidatus Nanoarchaeia archaeon]|nr:glycosyltransferase family 4 protein [Candidatus Nanoarchaeia archaeon]